VGRQDGIVGLDNRVGDPWRGVHAEFQLGLFAVVGGQTLEDERTETRTSATTERMEDKEALEAIAVVSQAAKFVHYDINLLLANCVMATRI